MTNSRLGHSIQVSSSHYLEEYDHAKRWSSYWLQIERAISYARGGAILEVGVGNGLVSQYLRRIAACNVTTLDIDPDLNPDVQGDITALPFADDSFLLAMACEVLEHLPWEDAKIALSELARIAPRVLVSIPDVTPTIQVAISVGPFRHKSWTLALPALRKEHRVRAPKEHFWEIGVNGRSKADFESIVAESGLSIREEVRNPSYLYHLFYVLERNP